MPTHDLARPLLNQLSGRRTLVSSRPTMRTLCVCLCLAAAVQLASPAPANGFAFPDESRREKKLEPIITPPVLPVLEHLERDPSTLLPNETGAGFRHAGGAQRRPVKPRFGGGFSVEPSAGGGLTASASSSGSIGGASHSASQSFSFGFDNGFSGSQSASQSASFSGGFGNGFSASQSSSQAAAFGGSAGSASASQAAAFGGGGGSGSQSGSNAFGFNSLGGFPSQPELNFGEGIIDARHRGAPGFPFPDFGRGRSVGAAAFRASKNLKPRGRDDWLAVVVRDN